VALITSQVSNVGKSGDAGSSDTMQIIDGVGAALTQTGQTITLDLTAPNTATYDVKSYSTDLAMAANQVATDYSSAINMSSGLIYSVWGFWNLTSTTSAINMQVKLTAVTGTLSDIDIAFSWFRGASTNVYSISANDTYSSAITATSTTAGVQVFGTFRCTSSGTCKFVVRQGTTNSLSMPYLTGPHYLYVYGWDPAQQNVYVDDNWGVDLA
jgi:hypothetical protein